MGKVLLKVNNLNKYFKTNKKNIVKAVDNVSLYINKNETLGIVGESGCGKTTLGRTILNLYPKTSGEIIFDGLNLNHASKKELFNFKKRAQIILQNPYASLNPRMTIKEIISEGINTHKISQGQEKEEQIQDLMELVGLNKEQLSRFPHEFSGGQRQRIGIARTLAVKPEFIVCDEPISSLDVSIQAQIINLLISLQSKFGITYLFIAHDLAMVKYISDRVAVMYMGSIVETATTNDIYSNPKHPYTKTLLSAIPSINLQNPISKRRIKLPTNEISLNTCGCKFYNRCNYKKSICRKKEPELREISKGHFVACYIS